MSDAARKLCSNIYRQAVDGLAEKPHAAAVSMQAPWVCVLEWDAPSHGREGVFAGVGVLVGSRHVLTCAHNVSPQMDAELVPHGSLPMKEKAFHVRTGGASLLDGTRQAVKRIDLHPGFEPKSKRAKPLADVAVLTLTEPVDLPYPTIGKRKSVHSYDLVSAFGFPHGADGFDQLGQVNTAIIPAAIGKMVKCKRQLVVANFAGEGSLDMGFSGGPVVSRPANAAADDIRLLGLVSGGVPGLLTEGVYGPPGLVTDLTYHGKWVAAMVAAHPARARR